MTLGFAPPSDTPYVPTIDLGGTTFGLVTIGMAGIMTRITSTPSVVPVVIAMTGEGHRSYTNLVVEIPGARAFTGVAAFAEITESVIATMDDEDPLTVMMRDFVPATPYFDTHLVAVTTLTEHPAARSIAGRVTEAIVYELSGGTDASAGGSSPTQNTIVTTARIGETALAISGVYNAPESELEEQTQMSTQMSDQTTVSVSTPASEMTLAGAHATNTVVAVTSVRTGASIGEEFSFGGMFPEGIREGVRVRGASDAGDEVFTCWCTNAENLASSEYRDYAFNSLCTIGGRYYAANESGVFLLEGDTDDGAPIRASVLTGLMDFGSPAVKHVPAGYVSRTATGDMLLKVVTVTGGYKQANAYVAAGSSAQAYRATRVPFGKGLRARYWQLELSNVGGVDFAVDEIALSPAVSTRRI